MARPRRTSSLGADPRGDTSAPSMATMPSSSKQVQTLSFQQDSIVAFSINETEEPADLG